MQELFRQLDECLQHRHEVAYCRLVETRGSTPQKAGAMMLIFPDGSQAGTLGGGCVEAEVKRKSLGILANGAAEIVRFQLDSDYGWDDGLICGGRMHVLLEPLGPRAAPAAAAYYRQLAAQALADGCTEAVVFDAKSAGHPAPASFLFDAQGQCVARLRAAAVPDVVTVNLLPLAKRPRPYAASGVSYLTSVPRCRLVIVGGGHVGQAVAQLAADLEFDVWVIDDRQEFVSAERFPRAVRRIAGQIEEVLPALEITPDTYCLIVTRGHQHDEQALYHLADRNARYVGLIGSRRKIKMIYDDLRQEGIAADALARVYAPLGIDIGSQTVPEIAVSICAELVSHRNRQGVVPGRPPAVELSP